MLFCLSWFFTDYVTLCARVGLVQLEVRYYKFALF